MTLDTKLRVIDWHAVGRTIDYISRQLDDQYDRSGLYKNPLSKRTAFFLGPRRARLAAERRREQGSIPRLTRPSWSGSWLCVRGVAYLLNIRILGPVAPLTGQYSRGGLN